MATHTIGTGGDFATPALWEADIPATLTEQRIGQCKNEEFVGTTNIVDFSAHVTTASFNIILECEAGASFNDNVNVRTNALRYNASNGCGFRTTNSYNNAILVSGNIGYLTVRDLQVRAEGATGAGVGACIQYSGYHVIVAHTYKDLILETSGVGGVATRFANTGGAFVVANVLAIIRNGSSDGVRGTDVTWVNCTIVRPDNVTPNGTGVLRDYGTPLLRNCAIFGFSTTNSASFSASSSNNATDLATGLPGTSNQHSVTYTQTSPFTNGDTTNGDYRLANDANALINNGVIDATNAPNDISGTVRANPPEIGVWELSAAAGNPHYYYRNQKLTMGA